MTNCDKEQIAADAAILDEHEGSVLRTVGWSFLVFDSIPVMWLFVGWRSGSWLWFWITLGLGVVGTALVVAGAQMLGKAAEDFAAAREAIRGRAVAIPGSEEPPFWQDVKDKAA